MLDKLRHVISSVMDKFFSFKITGSFKITEKDFDITIIEFKILLLESCITLIIVKFIKTHMLIF